MNFVSGIRKTESVSKSGGTLDILYKQTVTVDDLVYMHVRAAAHAIITENATIPTISRSSEIQVAKVPHVS